MGHRSVFGRLLLVSAAASLGAAIALATPPAHANGRFPASNQIVFSPVSPKTIVGRTTFGFLPSTDDGASWQWICEDTLALPSAMSSDPELALTAGGALVAGTPAPYQLGASVSNDLGCNWACSSAIGSTPVSDIVLRATSPHSVLAILATVPAADGGFVPSQVYETTDDGATWKPLGVPFDPTDVSLQALSIDVSQSDAQSIYVSVVRDVSVDGSYTRKASLFVSKDDASTWVEHPITAFDPTSEGTIYIGAVDPTDPDQVYLRSAGASALNLSANASCQAMNGGSHLYVTSDGGETFRIADPVAGSVCQILGFALSADGSRVYAGTFGDGLYAASKTDLKFTKTSSIHVECLATQGSELWACSDAISGFIFGSSTNEGVCFDPKLPSLDNIAGPIACAPNPSGPLACMATGNASICTEAAFQSLCDNPFSMADNCFVEAGVAANPCASDDGGTVASADGGTLTSTDGGSVSQKDPSKAGCGCATAGQRGIGWLAGLGLAFAVASAAALRRRSR